MLLSEIQPIQAVVTLAVEDLPDVKLALPSYEIPLKPGETIQTEFEISVPEKSLPAEVNHFKIQSIAAPEGTADTFEQTFIMPVEVKK